MADAMNKYLEENRELYDENDEVGGRAEENSNNNDTDDERTVCVKCQQLRSQDHSPCERRADKPCTRTEEQNNHVKDNLFHHKDQPHEDANSSHGEGISIDENSLQASESSNHGSQNSVDISVDTLCSSLHHHLSVNLAAGEGEEMLNIQDQTSVNTIPVTERTDSLSVEHRRDYRLPHDTLEIDEPDIPAHQFEPQYDQVELMNGDELPLDFIDADINLRSSGIATDNSSLQELDTRSTSPESGTAYPRPLSPSPPSDHSLSPGHFDLGSAQAPVDRSRDHYSRSYSQRNQPRLDDLLNVRRILHGMCGRTDALDLQAATDREAYHKVIDALHRVVRSCQSAIERHQQVVHEAAPSDPSLNRAKTSRIEAVESMQSALQLLDQNSIMWRPGWIWMPEEAATKAAEQSMFSTCGPTALLNVLRAFGLDVTEAEVLTEVQCNSRLDSVPIPDYLFSRSIAGTTAEELIRATDKLTSGSVRARFFGFFPPRKVDLISWIHSWICKGCVPVLTLNLQKVGFESPVPDSWHHQMVYGICHMGICVTNPLNTLAIEEVHRQLCSESELLIQRQDVVRRWELDQDLSSLYTHPPDQRWNQLNVLGQVMNVLREHQLSNVCRTSHVRIPAAYRAGVTLFARTDSEAWRDLEQASELPLDDKKPPDLPGHWDKYYCA